MYPVKILLGATWVSLALMAALLKSSIDRLKIAEEGEHGDRGFELAAPIEEIKDAEVG